MEFVCWNSSGDTLRCGGGLGLATLRVLNVVQTIILITPRPLWSSPAIVAMYQSVISVTVARGNLNVHTLRCAILRSLDHAATVSFRRLYFVKIKLFSRALATIKFCHKLLNYSLQGNLSRWGLIKNIYISSPALVRTPERGLHPLSDHLPCVGAVTLSSHWSAADNTGLWLAALADLEEADGRDSLLVRGLEYQLWGRLR